MALLSALATVFGGPCIIPPQGGGAPAGYSYALDNDNSVALDTDGARGMEAA